MLNRGVGKSAVVETSDAGRRGMVLDNRGERPDAGGGDQKGSGRRQIQENIWPWPMASKALG